MKIHTSIRDAKNMKLHELEAINRKVVEVQAIPTVQDNYGTDGIEETQEKETEMPKTNRKKKKEERV